MKIAHLSLLCIFAATIPAFGETDLKSVRFEQRLNARLSLDTKFTDENGRAVLLRDFFGKKPVVLVPGYYGCPMLCTLVANGLIESLQELRLDIGRDFEVVHFSIDPRETPHDALAKKQTYLKRYGRSDAENGWHFLTGTSEAIQHLADEIGFHYVYDASSKQYAHPSGFVAVTPEGKIARYFFGVNFSPNEMRVALFDASARKTGSPIEQLLLLCFHDTPISGKHGALIMNVLRAFAAATALAIGGFVAFAIQRERARRGAN